MTAPDPFAVFGLEPRLELDLQQLERKYLKLSRDCHPDRNRGPAAADCVAVLQRAANLNDAFAVLRDPWLRARALLELRRPGVLAQNDKLDPDFLMQALEQAEQVAQAHDGELAALRPQVAASVEHSFAGIVAAMQQGDVALAARRYHEARYHRKALADLDARLQPDPVP